MITGVWKYRGKSTTIIMFNLGQVRHKSIQNSSPDTIQQRLQQTSGTHTHEAAGGEVLYPSDTTRLMSRLLNNPLYYIGRVMISTGNFTRIQCVNTLQATCRIWWTIMSVSSINHCWWLLVQRRIRCTWHKMRSLKRPERRTKSSSWTMVPPILRPTGCGNTLTRQYKS